MHRIVILVRLFTLYSECEEYVPAGKWGGIKWQTDQYLGLFFCILQFIRSSDFAGIIAYNMDKVDM